MILLKDLIEQAGLSSILEGLLIEELAKKDKEGDVKIKELLKVDNIVNVNRLVKVTIPPKFYRKLLELQAYIIKLNIYIKYNKELF